jgi:hypothetical protein
MECALAGPDKERWDEAVAYAAELLAPGWPRREWREDMHYGLRLLSLILYATADEDLYHDVPVERVRALAATDTADLAAFLSGRIRPEPLTRLLKRLTAVPKVVDLPQDRPFQAEELPQGVPAVQHGQAFVLRVLTSGSQAARVR